MKVENSETWLVLGASRGLGYEFVKQTKALTDSPKIIAVSRQAGSLAEQGCQHTSCDLSRPESLLSLLNSLKLDKIDRVIYFAGGGPYGPFQSKDWKDHQWSLQVSFLSVAQTLHHFMQSQNLRQFIAIGSAIAENKADFGAAAYASAKHALRGLISSVQTESPLIDLRLFSPGYMNTTLLPKVAWPREMPGLVAEPSSVAAELLRWMQDSNFRGQNWSKASI